MSINNKHCEIELDELNIKSHLNASLELEGISVSEDLINRTLDAIKREETKINNNDEKPLTFIKRHSKALVSAAAAVIILTVSMTSIRLFTHKKMDQENTSDHALYKSDETAPKELANSIAEIQMNEGEVEEYTGAKENTSDFTVGTTAKTMDKDNTTENLGTEFKLTATQQVYDLKFTDITSILQDDVKAITIASEVTDKTVELTGKEEIDRLFLLMENHNFTYGADEQDTGQYIIKLMGDSTDSLITIGETSIEVDYTVDEIVSHSIYIAEDQSRLIEDIKEFLNE